MSASAIYAGSVVHTRLRPVRHRLRYRTLCLLLELDELPELARRLRLFSLNRFNLFDFRDRDHGEKSGAPLREQIEAQLRRAGIEPAGGAIRLLCMPRVLGAVFNPLSVYFCYAAPTPPQDGALQAMIYEVHNTFGERHSYLIPVEHDAALPRLRQSCAKRFYVSPFLDMAMTYHFRIAPPAERVAVTIEARDMAGAILMATFAGRHAPLTDANLLRAFLRFPVLAGQVWGGIHWEALKLWCKGLALRPRPAPPGDPVTIVNPTRSR